MIDSQWRLIYPGADFTFGTGDLPVFNRTTPTIGTPDIRTDDADRPRADGRQFGVDFYGGQTISFDLGVKGYGDADVREKTAQLRRAWRADSVRLVPGAVAELRARYAGRERVVFGRPRRFSPDYSDAAVNHLVTVLGDFACVDDQFYGLTEESVEFSITPPTGGGLEAPLASPLSTTASSDRSQGIEIVSELPVWPVIEISGPITNPEVNIGDVLRIQARVDLAHDESLVIDTRPWSRSALRGGTASVAGSLRGTRLSSATVPPGKYDVGLKGTDPTGTASVRLAWRASYSSL